MKPNPGGPLETIKKPLVKHKIVFFQSYVISQKMETGGFSYGA